MMSTTAPITITRRNCMLLTGLSWQQVTAFALQHGVPIVRLSPRSTVIDAAMFTAALQRVHQQTQRTHAVDALDMLLAKG